MKKRISFEIETELLLEIKAYAAEKKISISQLVEDHFKELTKSAKQPRFIEMVKNLVITEKFEDVVDFKKQYYEDNKAKYGF